MRRKHLSLRNGYCWLVCLVSVFCYTGLSHAQSGKDMKVSGGFKYASWSDSIAEMTGVIFLETSVQGYQNKNPVQVVLLLDGSRLAEGRFLQSIKNASKGMLSGCADADYFGLVQYSSSARVVVPLQQISISRQSMAGSIDNIRAEASRNLEDGLKKSAELFARVKNQQSGGKALVIVTCGNPDQGVTDTSKLMSLAREYAVAGDFSIMTIGYNLSFNEDLFISLARSNNGDAYFLEEGQVDQLGSTLLGIIQHLHANYSKSVSIEMPAIAGSEVQSLYGGELRDKKFQLGTFYAGSKKPFVFTISPRPAQRQDIAVGIDYFDPVRLTNVHMKTFMDISFSSGVARYDQVFAPYIVQFEVYRALYESIGRIRSADKNVRKEYIDQLNQTISNTKEIANTLSSNALNGCLDYLFQLQKDMENFSNENELIVKRVKYKYLRFMAGQ